MHTKAWPEYLKKKPLGRLKRSWKDNIKTGGREMGCKGVKWIELFRSIYRLMR
jgi:hypothetical protein